MLDHEQIVDAAVGRPAQFAGSGRHGGPVDRVGDTVHCATTATDASQHRRVGGSVGRHRGAARARVQRSYAPPPAYTPPGGAGPAVTSVAFLGDSLTAGTVDGGLGASNYTQLIGTRFGATVTNAATDGAGYVAAPGRTFREAQLPRVLAARPTLVVVQGSRTDADRPSPEVRDAADRLYAELRGSLPQARIVVIGPVVPAQENVPESVERARDAVREAAASAQLPFLDPIGDRWFDGTDADLVDPDSENLTDEGHRKMAELVEEDLRRIGIVPR